MKRYGHLWDKLISYENLEDAAHKAARGKRGKANVRKFMFHLEHHLWKLHDDLKNKIYEPHPYKTFRIFEPKERLISAASFRDRVTHHALCNVLSPIYERRFIAHSYASRMGKGTHAAIRHCQKLAKRHKYALKADVRKYFPSISHDVLKGLLARKIKDPHVLWLAYLIIDRSNPQDSVDALFPEEAGLPAETRRRGLPIGNQTSQFFANVYLDQFDQWLTTTLGVGAYLRYMDDFVVFCDDKSQLRDYRAAIQQALAKLGLILNENQTVIAPCWQGVRFLGQRVFPSHRVLAKKNVRRFRRRLRGMRRDLKRGLIRWKTFRERVQSWMAHAAQADSYRVRQRILNS